MVGARHVVEQGLFQRVKLSALLGMHVWPQLPRGRSACARVRSSRRWITSAS